MVRDGEEGDCERWEGWEGGRAGEGEEGELGRGEGVGLKDGWGRRELGDEIYNRNSAHTQKRDNKLTFI